MKKCYYCQKYKLLNEFGNDRSRKDGKSNRCILCERLISKQRRKTFMVRYNSYKWSAKYRNLSFNLTKEQFLKFWQKPCYYCGSEIETIGLDRVDNKKGYDMNNIVPCCKTCNYAKKRLTKDAFIKIAIMIAKNYGH